MFRLSMFLGVSGIASCMMIYSIDFFINFCYIISVDYKLAGVTELVYE
jgi:hypothetical protein